MVVIPLATAVLTTGLVLADRRDNAWAPTPEDVAVAEASPRTTQTTERPGDSALDVPRPFDGPLRVLFVGDSIAKGRYASTEETTFPALVAAALEAGGPVRYEVANSTGTTATYALDEGVGRNGPADLVFVEYGTADVDKSTIGQFSQDYPALLDELLASSPDATLVCAGPWGRLDKTRPFDAATKAACESRGGAFVPLSALYDSAPLHAEVGQPSLWGPAKDDFRPNDQGHRRIAGALLAPFGLQL
jgi:lysophospholipase L1-like esterase